MAKTKIHSLVLDSLSNIEYICFAQQVAVLIPSAKALHMAESVVNGYNANIARDYRFHNSAQQLVDRTKKAYRQRIKQKAHDG